MKIAIIAAAAALSALAAPGDALELLLPQPQRAERGTGFVPDGAAPKVVRGKVAGAPDAVAEQAYEIAATAAGVTITAGGEAGERYAKTTLAQLAKLSGGRVPACRISDWPALKWRGYMNDCGRNYLAVEGVKAMIDVMAAYKMNLFHWHLSDYHGWRLESKKYPQLNAPGAFRRQIGRYYTQDEFREIVRYAAERGVTVMPELDVPGHTLAFRKGMGISSMAAPGTDKVVSELFEELCSLADAKTMPFVHLGTDEVRTREEKCDESWPTTWAKTVNAAGRSAVVWAPGKPIDPSCDVIDMAWYDNHVTNTSNKAFDSARMYNTSWTPFEVPLKSLFVKPCRWNVDPSRKLGAITCTWHDDNVGDDTLKLFRECMVFPSIAAMGDNYWHGRALDEPEFAFRMPPVGSEAFRRVEAFERRMAAQRDTVLADFPHPFVFFRQTAMRWRISDANSGKVLRRNVAGGHLWLRHWRNMKYSLVPGAKGRLAVETWIKAPADVECGAWIDLSFVDGVYSRNDMPCTPKAGEWNQFNASIEINGAALSPPAWKQPGMKGTTPSGREQDIPYSNDLMEKPMVDEMPALREPYPVKLRKGWNHVRILTDTEGKGRLGAAFALFDGPVVRPRDVPGLEYRCDPPGEEVREVIKPDSFTMLNIVPVSPGKEDVAAADAVEFVERTGNPYCLYSLTLHPQGRPASKTVDAGVASYRKWASRLEGSAVKPGILLQAIVGHWTSDLAEKDVEPWQRAVNVKGTVTRYCPLDPGYREYIRDTARKLAECAPSVILSDDDVRAFSPLAECTCPLHTAEYNRRTKKDFTPEQLRAMLAKADWRSAEHMAFAELQRDTVAGICSLIREGIDSVDPSIPSGVCEPGWLWARRYTPDNAYAMAGGLHTPWARLANGRYIEATPKSEVGDITLGTLSESERLRNTGLLLLDESDTWPHNLWSKSSAAFHAKLAVAAFAGLKGAKIWLVNMHKGVYPVSRHYTDVLARHRGFYPAISAEVQGTDATGVCIPVHVANYPGASVLGGGSSFAHAPGGWAQRVFSCYGVPFMAGEDLLQDRIYALGGKTCVDRMGDAELVDVLSRRVLVDGAAATALIKRGFGKYIGVEAADGERPLFTGDYNEVSGDFMQYPKSSNPPIFRALDGAKPLSWLIWRESYLVSEFEKVAPSATLFANSLGGTVVATAMHFEMGGAYLYCEGRRRYVNDLLDALAGRPFDNVCMNAQTVMALSRRARDGSDLLLFENLNFDADDNVSFRRASRPASVEVMSRDGKWEKADFSYEGGVVRIDREWPFYDAVFLKVR